MKKIEGASNMDKQRNAQEYFIDLFKSYIRNYNKIFSKKYSPSIRELLDDYIELYNDIATSPENQKLKNSLKAQLDVMEFYVKDTILNKSILKTNLIQLKSKLTNMNNRTKEKQHDDNCVNITSEYFAIVKICSSLLKSFNKINIYELIISIIKSSNNYKEIDKCTECLINELMYDGYSIRYLQDWYRDMKSFHENDTSAFINEFSTLKKPKSEYHIYFTVKNDCDNLNLKHISDKIDLQPIGKDQLNSEVATHLLFNQMERAFKAVLNSMDEYSATNQIVKAFDSYCLILNLMEERDYKINQKVASGIKDVNVINKYNIESNDIKYILPNIDNREKNDLEDFLRYRKEVYQQNLAVGEISTIERSMNILKNGNYENEANTLINFWNVLEYILSYYSGDSIISKARYIIPKLMCLYYLKDKLNIFWNTLQVSRGYDKPIDDFIKNSKHDSLSEKYDIAKLLFNIKENGKELSKSFGTNKYVLDRKYQELGMIITGENSLYQEITDLHKRIEYDIVRIYRTRNILVHSGNITKTNILLKNARLMQYISNLMSVILHYKMKNSNHSISEILYSVPETYDCYLKDCEDFKKNVDNRSAVDIFKPSYLFL